MVSRPLISIIVPVYNVEFYLAECLFSLRNQSYGNIEIVCVNDGSSDNSLELLHAFERVDSRAVIINQENKGLAGARNTGMDAASGDIICFLDSDDRFAVDACKRIADEFVKRDPDALVFGTHCFPERYKGQWLIDTLGTPDKVFNRFVPELLFVENCRPFVWRNAFSASFLDRNDLRFEESMRFGEDQVFQFYAFPRTTKTVFISDELYEYRLNRSGSLMASATGDYHEKLRKHIGIADIICRHWTEVGDMELYPKWLFDWTVEFLVWESTEQPEPVRSELRQGIIELWRRWFSPQQIVAFARGIELNDEKIDGTGGAVAQACEYVFATHTVEKQADSSLMHRVKSGFEKIPPFSVSSAKHKRAEEALLAEEAREEQAAHDAASRSLGFM